MSLRVFVASGAAWWWWWWVSLALGLASLLGYDRREIAEGLMIGHHGSGPLSLHLKPRPVR